MTVTAQQPSVLSVSRAATHAFSKDACASVVLLEGLGVEGDAHCGATVRHRSRVRIDPTQINLRQVHLMQAELLNTLTRQRFDVAPGSLGENITTRDIDLLALPRDTLLKIGTSAVVCVTGLRNPCRQLDDYQNGLMRAVLERAPTGEWIRKCGVMATVVSGGEVRPGDVIATVFPPGPRIALDRV